MSAMDDLYGEDENGEANPFDAEPDEEEEEEG